MQKGRLPATFLRVFLIRGPRRKYFRWGFHSGSPPKVFSVGLSFGVPAESIFGGAFIRGSRRKYFRWGRSASNCVKAPSAQGSPRKIRKDFAWGKFSGSPPNFRRKFGGVLLFGVPATISAGNLVGYYFSGSPPNFRRKFCGVLLFGVPATISAGNFVGYYSSASPIEMTSFSLMSMG